MGIKIKNLQTGEFEKFNIPALKGEKGEPGEIEPSEKVDYIGKQHSKLRDTMNANVDYIIKTAIGEFNYLDYEGQHITATNSIEGHARSAILKGQTSTGKNLYMGQDTSNTDHNWASYPITLEPNTYVMSNDGTLRVSAVIDYETGNTITTDSTFTITTQRTVLLCGSAVNRDKFQLEVGKKPTDYEPYCLVSVKMPILTTTGKNLFNKATITEGEEFYNDKIIKSENSFISDFINAQPNTAYTMSGKTTGNRVHIFDKDKNLIYHPKAENNVIIMPNDDRICYMKINGLIEETDTWQLEKGTVATSYEPYKSNILHTPEEVVLRSLPNGVCDTLNLNTGEYVQHIGEIILSGSSSEQWSLSGLNSDGTKAGFYILSSNITPQPKISSVTVNNKLPLLPGGAWGSKSHEGCFIGANALAIVVNTSKLSTPDVEGIRTYLQSNPLTVQYELATPVIKTVDLSDNHVYSYKGTTHYSCSSEEGSLVPTLSVKVPTDTQLTIQEQKATTQTLLIKNMDLQQSIKEVQAMNLAFNTALYNSFNSIREEVEDIKKHVSTNENLEGSF